MQGQIIKIIRDLHLVDCEGKIYSCKCRGVFRKEHIIPLVGDYVLFSKEKNLIEKVLPRKNEFRRPKVSNLDQAFLVTSLKQPDFSFYLLDKLLVWMECHRVLPIICITKEDLLTVQEKRSFQKIFDYYRDLGYFVVSNQDLDAIKQLIFDKTSVFTGQTGAGKTTLLNRLNPEWNLETGDVSIALGRGRHTTRVVSLFSFFGGKIMDTPGFSALDLYEYSHEEIKHAFLEFSRYPCPFKDCTHTKEVDCCVKAAVLSGNILKSRYDSYLKMIGVILDED